MGYIAQQTQIFIPMQLVEMIMPKMGESIMEGTILTWLKHVGDSIEQDESVLEVATDKVDTEVPSLYSGKLKEIIAHEGEVVQVGKPIAIIETDDSVDFKLAPEEDMAPEKDLAPETAPEVSSRAPIVEETPQLKSQVGKFYSPLVINMAKAENISIEELDNFEGTGKDGRVTKRDLQALITSRKRKQNEATPLVGFEKEIKSTNDNGSVIFDGKDEIIEMDRMRKMIANRMLESVQTSPHVTSFVEADVSGIVSWRGENKRKFMDNHGQALTFTPIFIEAVVKAIKYYPMINVRVDGDTIIRKGDINIGMAVALPSGNLIVPVIHNADRLSLAELAGKVNDLAKRARNNQLLADDLSEGTFTISNVGSFGNVMGTPIIVQPQVGILALGAVNKKPTVIETIAGDAIAIRHKMFLSHSYDHRVVDGALGGMFVRRVADYLERFDTSQSI